MDHRREVNDTSPGTGRITRSGEIARSQRTDDRLSKIRGKDTGELGACDPLFRNPLTPGGPGFILRSINRHMISL